MRSEHVDEVLLVNYLLGNLTEEEEARVEDHVFADPVYLGALEAAEADLIDSYVRGEMSQADRRGFERRFLTSPGRRSKVEFAKALAIVTAEATPLAVLAQAPPSAWHALRELIGGWSPALRLAGGLAALICVAGTSWLAFQHVSMRSRLAALESREQGIKQELRHSQSRAESLAAQLQNRPAGEGSRVPLIASLVLMSGPSRAESRVEQLALAPGAQIARIEIQLEARDDYPRYRADLHTRGGKDLLILSEISRRRTGDGFTVSMDVPASILATGDYELALSGILSGQDAREIGFYYFRVQKQ